MIWAQLVKNEVFNLTRSWIKNRRMLSTS